MGRSREERQRPGAKRSCRERTQPRGFRLAQLSLRLLGRNRPMAHVDLDLPNLFLSWEGCGTRARDPRVNSVGVAD
jgi:hypothetical protein